MVRTLLATLLATVLAIALFLNPVNQASACEKAAGVVAFAKRDGDTFILLADHKINSGRGWAAFGGCVDPNETIIAGALREFREETACAFSTKLTINDSTPQVTIGKFTSFALEVPNQDANTSRPENSQCSGISYQERGPWRWVRLALLIDLIESQPPKLKSENQNISLPKDVVSKQENEELWIKSADVIDSLNKIGAFD